MPKKKKKRKTKKRNKKKSTKKRKNRKVLRRKVKNKKKIIKQKPSKKTKEPTEKILATQQILSVGMLARAIIKVLKKLTQDLCILLIMRDMEGLKKSHILKNNG